MSLKIKINIKGLFISFFLLASSVSYCTDQDSNYLNLCNQKIKIYVLNNIEEIFVDQLGKIADGEKVKKLKSFVVNVSSPFTKLIVNKITEEEKKKIFCKHDEYSVKFKDDVSEENLKYLIKRLIKTSKLEEKEDFQKIFHKDSEYKKEEDEKESKNNEGEGYKCQACGEQFDNEKKPIFYTEIFYCQECYKKQFSDFPRGTMIVSILEKKKGACCVKGENNNCDICKHDSLIKINFIFYHYNEKGDINGHKPVNAYLPYNDYGLKILGFYTIEFYRRHLCTYGKSLTFPNEPENVVYGSIHFKTSYEEREHGFPLHNDNGYDFLDDMKLFGRKNNVCIKDEYLLTVGNFVIEKYSGKYLSSFDGNEKKGYYLPSIDEEKYVNRESFKSEFKKKYPNFPSDDFDEFKFFKNDEDSNINKKNFEENNNNNYEDGNMNKKDFKERNNNNYEDVNMNKKNFEERNKYQYKDLAHANGKLNNNNNDEKIRNHTFVANGDNGISKCKCLFNICCLY